MYDLTDRPLVFIPVDWPGLAVNDDGEAVEVANSVRLQVEILDRIEFDAWLHSEAPEGSSEEDKVAFEVARLRKVVKGWRDVKMSGRIADFEDKNIRILLLVPGFPEAFWKAYADAWTGKVKVREGNSVGSPVSGREGEPTAETTKAKTKPS